MVVLLLKLVGAWQLDQQYLQDRANAEEEERMNGMESKCQVMALDMQAMTKSLEHMAVRFHTFSVVQKQLQILQDDFNQTQTTIINTLVQTDQHLNRLLEEHKVHGQLRQKGYSNSRQNK